MNALFELLTLLEAVEFFLLDLLVLCFDYIDNLETSVLHFECCVAAACTCPGPVMRGLVEVKSHTFKLTCRIFHSSCRISDWSVSLWTNLYLAIRTSNLHFPRNLLRMCVVWEA